MKILIITRNCPPLWGGMERLNLNLIEELSKTHSVTVIAPAGSSSYFSTGIKVYEIPLKPLASFLLKAGYIAWKISRRWKPDAVIAGSGLTAPITLFAAKSCSASCVVYLHGLDITVPSRLYKMFWLPALRKIDHVIVNSSATKILAQAAGIESEKIHIVHPGVEIPQHNETQGKENFLKRHNIDQGPILLSVGRLTTRKGLLEFVRDVLPEVVKYYPTIKLVIIGDTPTDSLFAKPQSTDDILDIATQCRVDKNIIFLGKLFGKELTDAYSAADIHVFPVRYIANDPEGFGMVAIEAAAYGLQTAGYATGGVIDAVKPYVSGLLAEADDAQMLTQHILTLLKNPIERSLIIEFSKQFAWPTFGEKISFILKKTSAKEN